MPPRKRRQSAQGEDIVRESVERQSLAAVAVSETSKVSAKEASCSGSEKRSIVRLSVKPDGSEAVRGVDKTKEVSNPTASTSEPTLTTGRQPTRFSTRIVKRPKRDLSPPESPVKKGKKASAPAEAVVTTTPETKGKRQWELWSVEDKDSFFEGLCEFGKDFESIHSLIVAKCKKKSTCMPITVKNKEQVRHFYYRTWHKISKLIQPVKDLKKDIQELYGLISYSVLRKKLRGGVNPNDKNWQKLNDLVHHGAATIKLKGKRIRVKTPACAALKKLSLYEEPKREPGPKVPEKIRLEFRAKTNVAFQLVQDQAFNPRVRITVRPDRHLQSLVKYLDQKWKLERLKRKERLNVTEEVKHEFRVYPCRSATLRSVSLEAIDEPVLQFCLDKHCKDSSNSPGAGKKRKESNQKAATATSTIYTEPNPSVTVEQPCKSVISEPCQCKDNCNTCSVRNASSLSAAIDLMRGSPSQKTLSTPCVCLCNKNSEDATAQKPGSVSTGDMAVGISASDLNMLGVGFFESLCTKTDPIDVTGAKCSDQFSVCIKPEVGSDSAATGKGLDTNASISSAGKCSTELCAMADGDNAMFPDMLCDVASVTAGDGTEKARQEHASPKSANSLNESYESVDNKDAQQKDNTTAASSVRTAGVLKSSQKEMEKVFKNMLDIGWTSRDGGDLTVAELYLMFGSNGELKLEYEWVNVRKETEQLQERLLMSLNNMLRRLSHLATMEITDFSKTTGASSTCSLCGHNPSAKQKSKTRSPTGKLQKPGKDMYTQTTGQVNSIPLMAGGLPTTSQNGVFRIPVMPSNIQSKPVAGTTMCTKDMLQKYNPANITMQRPSMRRKLKPISRNRGVANLVQRTILPKNSEFIAIVPMVPGTQISNIAPATSEITETIVGHPINGIQTQPVQVVPSSPSVTSLSSSLPLPTFSSPTGKGVSACETSTINTSLNMSPPTGDETLLQIPASHLATLSPRSLKAAGMSAMREHQSIIPPISVITSGGAHASLQQNVCTSSPLATKSSLSPPSTSSSLLDISLMSGDLSFSCLLDDSNSKTLDPGLVTPPLRTGMEDSRPSTSLHSPPVRSLFTPTPDQQWMNADVQELSLLSSFLESPSKPSTSTSNSMYTLNMPMSLFNDNSRDFHSHKQEVDSTLQSMMTESSIDYVKKFADLAEQIVQSDTKPDNQLKTD